MSGPKTSRYTLTPEQRRALEEQRKLELRRAVAHKTIQKASRQLLEISSLAQSGRQTASELLAQSGDDGGFGAVFSEIEQSTAPLAPLLAAFDPNDIESLEQTAGQTKALLEHAERFRTKMSAIIAANERQLTENLRAAIAAGFTAQPDKSAPAVLSRPAEEAAEMLRALAGDPLLPQECRAEVSTALARLGTIADETFLRNFLALTISPLMKKARQQLSECAACQAEFEALYAEYTALCERMGEEAREYPCAPASLEPLRAAIHALQQEAAADDEQAYISRCLDEVMEEMGYSVLGEREVVKKSGKRFRNELYSFGEGTAVNVIYSSDGKIAMELGGLDDSDRMPTPEEAGALRECMEDFCGDFGEIEERLRGKGVVLAERISLLPPDSAYAQIINTADYRMSAAAGRFEAKRRDQRAQRALRKD